MIYNVASLNRKSAGVFILVGIGLAALLSLWGAPVSFLDLLKQPLQSLWGSHQQLQTGILEVSENVQFVQDATRRLLQPLGALRLTRRYPTPAPPDTSNASHAPADSNTSNSNNP